MVQKVKVISSVELYDNRNDSSRVYDIESNVHIEGGNVEHIDGGNVFHEGLHVASFSRWSNNHISVTYMNVELDEQNSINAAVNGFIAGVKETVSNN